ncbi:MAG: ABC transporter permease [Acidobacteriota bacterium]
MSAFLAVLERELRAVFVSPLAYVVLTFVLLANGFIFWTLISHLSDPAVAGAIAPMQLFFGGTILFWLLAIAVPPLLTMRLVSEEYRSGTIEPLMTAPVTAGQVVVAKYLSALAFYAFLWLPSLLYAALLARHGRVDWGPVASGMLGVLLVGALLLAIGVVASSLARNQIVAAVIAVAAILLLFMLVFFEQLTTDETLRAVIGYVSPVLHMEELAKGIVDTRRLVFYPTAIGLLLFLSARILATRQWR